MGEIELSLEQLLGRTPTGLELHWSITPAYLIGDDLIGEHAGGKVKAIVGFPTREGGFVWGYKIGEEGNEFFPEKDLKPLESFTH